MKLAPSETEILSLVWKEKILPLNFGSSLVGNLGLQFLLCNREESIEELKSTIRSHLKTTNKDRKDHMLPVLAGTPDVGKVILGNPLFCFVSFQLK